MGGSRSAIFIGILIGWVTFGMGLLIVRAIGGPVTPAQRQNHDLAPATVDDGDRLQKLFASDVLGADLAYVEQMTGSAYSTLQIGEHYLKTYKYAGCLVLIGTNGISGMAKVRNIGMSRWSGKCHFNYNVFFRGDDAPEAKILPSFGDLIAAGYRGTYQADCLKACGNASDPVVYLYYQGPHSEQFIDMLASVSSTSDAAFAPYENWSSLLEKKYGEDYVLKTKFNCDASAEQLAAPLFQSVRPDTLRVGWDLPQQTCAR